MSDNLLQVLVRARSGDDESVNVLIDDLHQRVFGVAVGMLGNRADAEEISQDIYLRLIRGSKRFASDDHLRAWTRRATIHACLKSLRSRRSHLSLIDTEMVSGEQSGVDSADILLKALAELTERERAAFLLTVHLGLDSSEAAQSMNCAPGTVRALSRRAREKLQPSIKRLHTWETRDGQKRPAD